jgi:sugar/nucleoside kinase (ribokinase family)
VTPDLVLLGNLLVDDVVFADGRTRMAQAGGAILYSSLTAALWGARVGAVSLQGDDYPPAALARLSACGVLLDGVHPLHADGVRTWLLYEDRVRRVIHRLGGPSHEAVSPSPDHVPRAWRGARAFHLAPMPLAIQSTLVTAIRAWESPARPAFISVDPYVLVTPDTLGAWRELLSLADAFFPSDDELLLPGAASAPAQACAALASGRLRYVAWKRGAAGGSLYDVREQQVHTWRTRPGAVEDPTGAGDAFAAGFLTAYLEGHALEQCLRRAVISTEFAIGAWGPDGLLSATRAAAEARLAAWSEPEVRS